MVMRMYYYELRFYSYNMGDVYSNFSSGLGGGIFCGCGPFLKWVGGKRQLLGGFRDFYPDELKCGKIKVYYEPFLGSGAVFFDVVQNYSIGSAYLYDINEDLILTYLVVQRDVNKLLEFLYSYERVYLSLDREGRVNLYYSKRDEYNLEKGCIDYNNYSDAWILRASKFIFLNKLCYNGFYRVNSRGEFNSPVGDCRDLVICDERNLLVVSDLLSIAEIRVSDFRDLWDVFVSGSFVYFDPPNRVINKTVDFRGYSGSGFSDNDCVVLSDLFKYLDSKGLRLMLSNFDLKGVDLWGDYFNDLYCGYNVFKVSLGRGVNYGVRGRSCVSGFIVTNYFVG